MDWASLLVGAARMLVSRPGAFRPFTVNEEAASDLNVARAFKEYQRLEDWERAAFQRLLALEQESAAAVCDDKPTTTMGDDDERRQTTGACDPGGEAETG